MLLPEYLWTFDTIFQGLMTTCNAVSRNGATFSANSINGYGSSLELSASSKQYLYIPSPQLQLQNRSWTFEAWIYLTYNTTGHDYTIIGQCKTSGSFICLHIQIRNQKLYFGHYADDQSGATNLIASRWYHAAFVFDCPSQNQSVYLDGLIDGSRESNHCFQGYNQSLTIGAVEGWGPWDYFDGLIDQVYFTNRSKTSGEILRDATLTVSFSFDNNSIYDLGPLRINGSLVGNTTFISGRVGQALQIENVNPSCFRVKGLVLLGTSNRPYSLSVWIRPYLAQRSSIMHGSSAANGTGWWRPLLGLTNTSRLMSYSSNGSAISVTGPVVSANSWSHVAVTYSSTNGLRMYVNGTLFNSSAPFVFMPSGTPMYLFAGNPGPSIACGSILNVCGSYSGAVDELRVYSRQLTFADIVALANP